MKAISRMTTRLTMAILFFFRRRMPSFQKLTLSRMMTRLFFSSLDAGAKSSTLSCRLNGFFFRFSILSAPPYFSLMRGSMILYRMSTMTLATMTRVASRIVVPMIIM